MAGKKMSDRVLSECHRHFWSNEGKKKTNGMLSWGDFTKMLRNVDLKLNNICMNSLYRISDQQKHGCITLTEFLATYCQHELKVKPAHKTKLEHVHNLSAQKLNDLRKEFFDKTRKRYGRLNRLDFAEMTFRIGVTLTNEEMNEALLIADRTPNGTISFEGFICWFLMEMRNGDSTAAELEIIRRCFSFADSDGDGKLSRSEFRGLLKNAGLEMSDRAASDLFRKADADRSGTISFEEFKEVCLATGFSFRCSHDSAANSIQLSLLGRERIVRIREYFGKFDKNRDGRLSYSESSMMFKMSDMPKNIVRKGKAMIQRNKDCSLSFRDFLSMFSNIEELDACISSNM